MDFKVEIKGLRELQAKLSRLPGHVRDEVEAIVENGAKNWVAGAKRDCTAVDSGFLRNGITYAQSIMDKTRVSFEVVSNAHYSAYIEWGTINKVDVPAELADYAAQFRGRGLRTTGGITPKPFFFKQQLKVKQLVENGLKTLIQDIKV